MLSCVTPKERAAKFVCEKNYMAAMHARLRVIINAGALTQRQLKEERLRAEKAVAVTAAGSESGSPLAAHVANYTLVNDAVLGRAAAPPRARDADATPFAYRSEGQNVARTCLEFPGLYDRVLSKCSDARIYLDHGSCSPFQRWQSAFVSSGI